MKERKSKKSENANRNVIIFISAFIIWLYFIVVGGVLLITNVSLWIKLIHIVITLVYTIWGYGKILKREKELKRRKIEKEKKILEELKIQYSEYVELVDKKVKERLMQNISKENFESIINTNCEYLSSFSNKLDWVCKNRIVGKPDSFIVATCMMYSLIEKPKIRIIQSLDEETKKKLVYVNIEIAINCALEIISEPKTYYKDTNGNWVEEKHPKVDIVVPNGLIRDYKLYNRIRNAVYKDRYAHQTTSIMQFSNLLHLIYLNCQ